MSLLQSDIRLKSGSYVQAVMTFYLKHSFVQLPSCTSILLQRFITVQIPSMYYKHFTVRSITISI
jgi:hypothetical protein